MGRDGPPERRVALVGASGLLGGAVAAALRRRGRAFHAPSRGELDLSRPERLANGLDRIAPDAVINAAAFADVAGAESTDSRREVFLVNRDGPGALARACAARDLPLVHLSTDYVFDGEKGQPYREEDEPRPLQVYGESKLQGERQVRAACPSALVVRTSTLFGPGRPRRPHYVDAILRQARQGTELRVVEPPVSSPTYTLDLAEAVIDLLDLRATGVVHVVNAGGCSRLDLARAVVEFGMAGGSAVVGSRPEPTGGLRRPLYSVLDTSRFAALTGAPLRPWRAALAAYLEPPPA